MRPLEKSRLYRNRESPQRPPPSPAPPFVQAIAMETPEVLAHRSVPQVAPGTYYFVLGVIAVFYAAAVLLFMHFASPQISETGDEIHSFRTEAIRIVGGVGLTILFPYLIARFFTSRFESMMTPRRAEAALMKVHALELLRAGVFSHDDMREIQRWLNKIDRERKCDTRPEWRRRGDTPIERFANILAGCPSWDNATISGTSVIPANASGTFTVILESSTDQYNWTPANQGDYSSTTVRRFFRTRIVKM